MNEHISEIKSLIAQNNYKKALELISMETQCDKFQDPTIYEMKAFCAVNLCEWELAIKAWLHLIKLLSNDKKKIEVYWNIALAAEKIPNEKILKEVLINSLAIEGGLSNTFARMKLCELAHKQKDFALVLRFGPELLTSQKTQIPACVLLINAATGTFKKSLALSYLKILNSAEKSLTSQLIAFITHHYIKLNEYQLAYKTLNQAKEKSKDQAWYKVLNGMLLNEQGNYIQTISLLKGVKINDLPTWFKQVELLYVTLGKALEKKDEFEQSFNTYKEMGQHYKVKYRNVHKFDVVKAYQSIDFNRLTNVVFNGDTQPVFMLGFPRSGTTLLETIVDTNDRIETLSEPHTISAIVEKIKDISQLEDYTQYLHKLSVLDIKVLRELYFSNVEKALDKSINGKVFIDKMPLYTIYLPVIKLLFPEAKFIINIRHPLDVILSNFQQNFTVNNEMAFLFSIEDCANRYEQVMGFLDLMEKKFQLDRIEIRYEDLISDVNNEINRLLKFLGLEAMKDIENFHYYAKQKVINTPSTSQVSKPLYQSSKYKWKNYEQQLLPYKKQLSYFIKKYGYE